MKTLFTACIALLSSHNAYAGGYADYLARMEAKAPFCNNGDVMQITAPKKKWGTIAKSDSLEWPDELKDVRKKAVTSAWGGWEPIADTSICIYGSPEWKKSGKVLVQQDGNYVVMDIKAVEEVENEYSDLYDLQQLVQADKLTVEEYKEKAAAVIKAVSSEATKRHTASEL
jgi:translation elongation factor P/translation initiation factor 5A